MINIKFEVDKDKDGNHMLRLGMNTANWVIPMGKDLLYALYKGVGVEAKHFDMVLNDDGKAAIEAAKAQQEAQNGSKEQVEVSAGGSPANAENPVHPV